MITPFDIKNQEFNKSFRGYSEMEVDQFLDQVINSYEKVYNENVELKDQILVLKDNLKKYSNLEETIKDTLLVAQTTGEEIINSSKEKADLIINEAELKSKKILDSSMRRAEESEKVYKDLIREASIFKTRYRNFIESQLITLEDFKIVEVDERKRQFDFENEEDKRRMKEEFEKESQRAKDLEKELMDKVKFLEKEVGSKIIEDKPKEEDQEEKAENSNK